MYSIRTIGDYEEAVQRAAVAQQEQHERDHPDLYTRCPVCGFTVPRASLANGLHEEACRPF